MMTHQRPNPENTLCRLSLRHYHLQIEKPLSCFQNLAVAELSLSLSTINASLSRQFYDRFAVNQYPVRLRRERGRRKKIHKLDYQK